ncbi:MAG: nucleoside-diphosphate kinase [Bacillota bacterium]
MKETTLVLIKPDAVRRGLVGRIIARLEDKGLSLSAARLLLMDEGMAREHYREHAERPFFPELISFITSGPLLALAVTGPRAIAAVRSLAGDTDPLQATPGSLRGQFGLQVGQNIIHASDCKEAAERELALFFQPEDIIHQQ